MKKFMAILTFFKVIPLTMIYSKMPEIDRVKRDLQRRGHGTGVFDLHLVLCEDRLYRNVFLCRLAHWSRWAYRVVKLCYRPADMFGLDVESGELGGGVMVFHGNSTIVYAHSIGWDFVVHQNVTVGRGKNINGRAVPVIGDNVMIGTGAIVVGGITIGSNVKIGAGAVVVKDVPANCTVVGNPMRIIRK